MTLTITWAIHWQGGGYVGDFPSPTTQTFDLYVGEYRTVIIAPTR